VEGLAMTMPDAAPDDFDPSGPMLANTPALAMGVSDWTYESTFCCTETATREHARREVRRRIEAPGTRESREDFK
jgi:hypothetical protein